MMVLKMKRWGGDWLVAVVVFCDHKHDYGDQEVDDDDDDNDDDEAN